MAMVGGKICVTKRAGSGIDLPSLFQDDEGRLVFLYPQTVGIPAIQSDLASVPASIPELQCWRVHARATNDVKAE